MFLISDEQGLDARGIVVWAPPGAGDVSFLHSIQAGYGALQASYWMGTGRSFSGIKVDHSLALWRSWLRHCTSIPDGDIGICNWHNPSGRTVALRLTQLLTEMSTRDISWERGGKGGRCVGLTTLHLHVPIFLKSGSLILLEPSGPPQACNWIAITFTRPNLQPRLRLGGAIPLLLHTPGCLAQGQLYIYFNSSSNDSLNACLLIFHVRSHVPDRDSKAIWRCVSHYWVKLYYLFQQKMYVV